MSSQQASKNKEGQETGSVHRTNASTQSQAAQQRRIRQHIVDAIWEACLQMVQTSPGIRSATTAPCQMVGALNRSARKRNIISRIPFCSCTERFHAEYVRALARDRKAQALSRCS